MYFRRGNGFMDYLIGHPVTTIIILINLLFYLVITIPFFPNRLLFELLAGVNILIANGDWWRLITPMFIHQNFHHLLFNTITFLIVGPMLEQRVKKSTFFFIYISAGIFANVITYIFASLTFVHVGSSGAVFGILGVFAAFIYYKRTRKHESQSLLAIILLALLYTFIENNTNIYAHLGGFVWGCFCGYLLKKGTIR